MAGLTSAQAEAKLTAYLDAETKVLSKQSVTLDGQTMTYADLDKIQKGIEIWNKRCQDLGRTSGMQVREVIPR